MGKFSVKITMEAPNAEHAKKVGAVLQNMVDNTDTAVQARLFEKITKTKDFFKSLLQNPFVRNFL